MVPSATSQPESNGSSSPPEQERPRHLRAGERELRALAALQPPPALPHLPLRPRERDSNGTAGADGKDSVQPLGGLSPGRPSTGKATRASGIRAAREAAGRRAVGVPPVATQGRDAGTTSAHQIVTRPPRELTTTRIYYDSSAARAQVRHLQHRHDRPHSASALRRATITSSKSSPARRTVRRLTWRR